MMNRILGAGIAALMLIIGLMYWQMSKLETKITDQAKTIGQQSQAIDEYHAALKSSEVDKKMLRAKFELTDAALAKSVSDRNQIAVDNRKLKVKLKGLSRENKEIKKYLDGVADLAIIGLFRQSPDASYRYDANGICITTDVVNDGNACPVYRTRSIVNYALDLETALDSCNSDKAALRDWVVSIGNAKIMENKDD